MQQGQELMNGKSFYGTRHRNTQSPRGMGMSASYGGGSTEAKPMEGMQQAGPCLWHLPQSSLGVAACAAPVLPAITIDARPTAIGEPLHRHLNVVKSCGIFCYKRGSVCSIYPSALRFF